jgi:hypothetical protein
VQGLPGSGPGPADSSPGLPDSGPRRCGGRSRHRGRRPGRACHPGVAEDRRAGPSGGSGRRGRICGNRHDRASAGVSLGSARPGVRAAPTATGTAVMTVGEQQHRTRQDNQYLDRESMIGQNLGDQRPAGRGVRWRARVIRSHGRCGRHDDRYPGHDERCDRPHNVLRRFAGSLARVLHLRRLCRTSRAVIRAGFAPHLMVADNEPICYGFGETGKLVPPTYGMSESGASGNGFRPGPGGASLVCEPARAIG